jgi:hypothetical protein
MGVVIALAMHLFQIPLAVLAGVLGCALGGGEYCGVLAIAPILLIGVSQLVYQGPLAIFFWRKGKRPLLQGLIIGAAITLGLNAACWGLLVGSSALTAF